MSARPHSGTTVDMIGSVGVAILVIIGATVLMDRLPRLRHLAKLVIAVGTMSLTAYVGDFPVQTLGISAGESTQVSWVPVLALIFGAIVFAALWSRYCSRGPLERRCSTPPPSRRSTSDDAGLGRAAFTTRPGYTGRAGHRPVPR